MIDNPFFFRFKVERIIYYFALALSKLYYPAQKKPFVIIGETTKGCGVDFMENNNEWHHNKISKSVYEQIKSL